MTIPVERICRVCSCTDSSACESSACESSACETIAGPRAWSITYSDGTGMSVDGLDQCGGIIHGHSFTGGWVSGSGMARWVVHDSHLSENT